MTVTQGTILVVDDDQPVRLVLNALLETEGFGVLEAADAKSCLRLTYENRPDLVLHGHAHRRGCRMSRLSSV